MILFYSGSINKEEITQLNSPSIWWDSEFGPYNGTQDTAHIFFYYPNRSIYDHNYYTSNTCTELSLLAL